MLETLLHASVIFSQIISIIAGSAVSRRGAFGTGTHTSNGNSLPIIVEPGHRHAFTISVEHSMMEGLIAGGAVSVVVAGPTIVSAGGAGASRGITVAADWTV